MDEFEKKEELQILRQCLEEYCPILKEELNLKLLCDMDLTGDICWLEDLRLSDLVYAGDLPAKRQSVTEKQ